MTKNIKIIEDYVNAKIDFSLGECHDDHSFQFIEYDDKVKGIFRYRDIGEASTIKYNKLKIEIIPRDKLDYIVEQCLEIYPEPGEYRLKFSK